MQTAALLDVSTIYLEPAVRDFARGREVLGRFPGAELIEVPSHWQIPELHGNEGSVERWNAVKRSTLVLGIKKGRTSRPNGRSADFIAPSTSNGCAMSCAYCYVPRRKGFANPITTFVNIEQVSASLERHVRKQGPKPAANQCDGVDPVPSWVYDLGENGDLSVDAAISDNPRDLIELFRSLPTAKATFATKQVNRDLLDYDPRGRTRVRFSLMPAATSRLLDVRTSPIEERIAAIDDFVAAGYEVHLNLSPVVVTEGWTAAWAELLEQVADGIGPAARAQLCAEVIFLTHNEALHEVNLGWHPRAEELLWRPELQEAKASENGQANVRYARGKKARMVAVLRELIESRLPGCRIRYAF